MVHYFGAALKRLVTMLHLFFLKVVYGKKILYRGKGVVDISSHFTVNDDGRIIVGKHIGV